MTDSEGIVVKESPIEGWGVFAARDFKKGEAVVNWNVQKELGEEEYKMLSVDEKRYINFLDGKYLVMGEPARFVNHSCDANTEPINRQDVAIRDIVAGEEITSNYSSYSEPQGIPCHCGTAICKGTL